MPTVKKTEDAAAQKRKRGQLLRLQERFVLASDSGVARELASGMLALAGQGAVPFLLTQGKRRGHVGEAAIAALHAEPQAGEAIVGRLEARYDDARLARSLSPQVPRRLSHAVENLLDEVTDATALRYLVEVVAQADPRSIPKLHRLADTKGDTRLGEAILTGLAAAGDEAALTALTGRLPGSTSPRWRLMLSCPPLAASPAGLQKLRELLRSKRSPDRVFALRAIAAFELVALAQEVAERFIEEDERRPAAAAAGALSVTLRHLPVTQVDTLIASTCDTSGLRSRAGAQPLASAVLRWAARVDRAGRLYAEGESGGPELLRAVILGVLQATNMLAPHLADDYPRPEVLDAYAALLTIQAKCLPASWQDDRRITVALQREMAGQVVEGMLHRIAPLPSQGCEGELLAQLRDECLEGAREAWRAVVVEQPQQEAEQLSTSLARCMWRRVRLLQQVGDVTDGDAEVADALRSSREREDKAWQTARFELGHAAVDNWQKRFDERLLVMEPQVSIIREFLKRRGRGLAGLGPPESVVALSGEQILQTDLCVMLTMRPLSSRVVGQLVGLLQSRSAVVRATAEVTLARHPEVAGQLRGQLKQQTDPPIQARLLEISRCLGSPRLRGFAIEAVGAEHELLAAAALKYLGQFGKMADLASLPYVLRHEMSSVVRTALLQAQANLLKGDAERSTELAMYLMSSPSTFEVHIAFRLVLGQPREIVLPALSRLAAGDDAIARTRSAAFLRLLEHPLDPSAVMLPDALVTEVAGEGLLGQSLMVTGDDPWQWGLPGLFEPFARLPGYWHLICKDDQFARSWDEWVPSGQSPLHLLPRLQGMMGGEEADAAAALALDIMDYGAGIYAEACAYYHGLPLDHRFQERAIKVCVEVLRQCTPAVVATLRIPNPSRAAIFGELLSTSKRENMKGHIFFLVFAELLKEALGREFRSGQEAPPEDPRAFRRHVEQEWDVLKPHEDWYYGFWVWPRLSLADMGRYCGDKNADPLCRQEIASYLAYEATTVPVLPRQAREAQRALAMAFDPHLRQTAQCIVERHRHRGNIAAEVDPQALQEGMCRKLAPAYRKAVRDFDVYWLSPHPIFALGTLRMAWEKHRPTESRDATPFPERHLSFARRLEKAIRHIVIEQFSGVKELAPTVTYEQAELETSRSAEKVGQLVKEAKDEEERTLRRIARGKSTKPIVNRALRSRPPAEPPILPQTVVIEGRPMECFDMRSARLKLGRSLPTLRKYGDNGDIRFVRDDEGDRWLPVDEIHRAEVVLRRMGEWAKLLDVSKETARKRLGAIAKGTDPLEMEEMLLAMKGDGRRRGTMRDHERVRKARAQRVEAGQ
jgi:hypothetical protein